MEMKGSLPWTQGPTNGPYPEPVVSYKIHFSIILPSMPMFPSGHNPWGFRLKFCMHFSPATRVMYSACLIILDLFTLIMYNKQYKLCSSSLHNFLHPLATSSLLDPDITATFLLLTYTIFYLLLQHK
jgi:hypothetical protein